MCVTLTTYPPYQLSETRRELNILKASHLKLTRAAEEQTTEVRQLTAAGQAQQEQLQELLGAKEEQEYRLQTTIAQQSKLIELAMQTRTPTKGTSITKVCQPSPSLCSNSDTHCSPFCSD